MRTRHYGAIVVGGGILGWSTAYHLQQQGVHDITVIDVSHPGVATTGAGAGFVGEWAAGFGPKGWGTNELALEQYSLAFYKALGQRHDIHLRSNGNLFLARSAHGYDTWIAPMLTHPLAPADTRALNPSEIHAISGGCIATNEVYGAVYHPQGIQVHTTPAVVAIAHEVLRHGATAIYGQQVVELLHENNQVSGVKTNSGQMYHANHVIVAAGAWSNTLLTTVGLTLPLYRVVATRIIGQVCGVPDCLPTVMIPEQGAWIREHRGALMWGTGDGYAAVYDLPQIASVGTRPHYPELVTSLTDAVQASFQRLFPAVDMSVADWTQGMPAYTADRTFIAGAVPGINGLWAITGDNEAGVTHAPALGRVMADLVTQHARPEINNARFALERFTHTYADERAVAAAMPPRR